MGAQLLFLLTAAAQEPVAEPPDEEIVVWGQLAIDRAHDDLVRQLEDLGFTQVRRRDGDVVFRTGSPLLGRVTLTSDGALQFGRPLLGLTATPEGSWDVQSDPDPRVAPVTGGGASFWTMPSANKVENARQQVLAATEDELAVFVETVQRTILEEQLLALPGRLDATWSEGAPLEGGPPLVTATERRTAILELWATRVASFEGDRVRHAIEAWLAAVVQVSADPITPEERARYESMAGRPLPP